MREGTISRVSDTEDPRKSTNTTLIGAALAAGAEFNSTKPLHDSIDGEGKRQVTWAMDGDKLINFSPDFEEEDITFAEFRKRFDSREWCEENESHPIAYMRAYRDKMNRLRDRLRELKPLARITKGKRTAFIPHDATDAQRAEILKMLG